MEFHVITIGVSEDDEAGDIHYVAPTSLDAPDIMAGAEPTAVCGTYRNACLIVDALNAFSANYSPTVGG